jgi:hypothetical protein
MKRTMFVVASLSFCLAADAAKLGAPISPQRVSRALRSGQSVKIAFSTRNSTGCIGVDRARKDADAPLMRFNCDLPTSNNPNNQYWILTPTKVEGETEPYFTIKNWKSEKCIGVDDASPLPGVALKQFVCKNHANQKWKLTTVKRGGRTALSIQNFDRLCIGIGNEKQEYPPLLQEKCNAQPDQDWRLIPFRVH